MSILSPFLAPTTCCYCPHQIRCDHASLQSYANSSAQLPKINNQAVQCAMEMEHIIWYNAKEIYFCVVQNNIWLYEIYCILQWIFIIWWKINWTLSNWCTEWSQTALYATEQFVVFKCMNLNMSSLKLITLSGCQTHQPFNLVSILITVDCYKCLIVLLTILDSYLLDAVFILFRHSTCAMDGGGRPRYLGYIWTMHLPVYGR